MRVCDVCGSTPEVDGGPGAAAGQSRQKAAAHGRRARSGKRYRATTDSESATRVVKRRPGAARLHAPVAAQRFEEEKLSAFIVMHDTSLEALCRLRPRSLEDFREVPGFGDRKVETYGARILAAFAEFDRGTRAAEPAAPRAKPIEETLRFLREGKSMAEIGSLRQRQPGSIATAVALLIERGDVEFDEAWVDPARRSVIEAACALIGTRRLKPLKDSLPAEVTYEEIRLVVARLRRLEMQTKESASA